MKTTKFLLTAILLIATINIISAAGVASPYWSDYPLNMNYGESKTIDFNFQNLVGNQDMTIEVSIKQGNDIATLSQTRFTAKQGTSDTMIPLTITIPKDYNKNVQKIELEFKTVTADTGGMVTLGTAWTSSFNVVLSEKPVSKGTWLGIIIALIVALIILITIILVLVKKKKR
jgi:hypothetical protein